MHVFSGKEAARNLSEVYLMVHRMSTAAADAARGQKLLQNDKLCLLLGRSGA
jgi:hypothetical protein